MMGYKEMKYFTLAFYYLCCRPSMERHFHPTSSPNQLRTASTNQVATSALTLTRFPRSNGCQRKNASRLRRTEKQARAGRVQFPSGDPAPHLLPSQPLVQTPTQASQGPVFSVVLEVLPQSRHPPSQIQKLEWFSLKCPRFVHRSLGYYTYICIVFYQ